MFNENMMLVLGLANAVVCGHIQCGKGIAIDIRAYRFFTPMVLVNDLLGVGKRML